MNALRHPEKLDRTLAYQSWHRQIGTAFAAIDVDQVEVRYRDGAAVPVALLELTSCETTLEASGLLSGIWARLAPPDSLQGAILAAIAAAVGVPAYVVVFQSDLERFGVRRLDGKGRWHIGDRQQYAEWLKEL